jgi:hypothetical protein
VPTTGRTGSARRGSDWPAVACLAGAQAAVVAFEGVREGVGAVGRPRFGVRGEFVARCLRLATERSTRPATACARNDAARR